MRASFRLVVRALTTLALIASSQVQAQAPPAAATDASCPRTRAEVRAECVEFLRTHRWDEGAGGYVPLAGSKGQATVAPPEGVKTRAEVRAERDAFLRSHRWIEASSTWEPVDGAPRKLSTLSRAQLRKEMRAFVRSYTWDEATQSYVPRQAKPRPG